MGALTSISTTQRSCAALRRVLFAKAWALLVLALTVCAGRAHADADGEARARYERALELYESGVYDAALVELDRAYELRPSYKLLYNIGQVRMAMNDYAGALEAYRQYLREAGPRLPAARREAVQGEVTKLEQRVAELTVECDLPDAEVLVDDLTVGSTPLSGPVLVNAGVRRVLVRHAQHGSQSKRVSLAGGDRQTVSVHFLGQASASAPSSTAAEGKVTPPPTTSAEAVAPRARPAATTLTREPAAKNGRRTVRVVSWSVTASLLTGAVVTGLFAMKSSNELESMREHELVTRDELREQETRTSRLAIASDVLTGLTVVAAAASLWITLKREKPQQRSAGKARVRRGAVALGVGPHGMLLHTRF